MTLYPTHTSLPCSLKGVVCLRTCKPFQAGPPCFLNHIESVTKPDRSSRPSDCSSVLLSELNHVTSQPILDPKGNGADSDSQGSDPTLPRQTPSVGREPHQRGATALVLAFPGAGKGPEFV